MRSSLEICFRKFILPTLNQFFGRKISNSPTTSDSEVRNSETTEHVDKQITDVSSTINALQNGVKLGASPRGVLMQPMEKTDDAQKLRICVTILAAHLKASF